MHLNTTLFGNNMRKFNLKEALAGAPLCTREGVPVEFIEYDPPGSFYKVVARIKEIGIDVFTKNGKYDINTSKHPLDLFIADDKYKYCTGWINLSSNDNIVHFTCGIVRKSKKEAYKAAHSITNPKKLSRDYRCTVKINYKVKIK